ncbi:MAG: RNA pseudouridine synthase [Treponema sp.]|jgi:23S rRNA pseudouridine1911/1915/1917 synthase|nr:RNA pseudouridine synthase [Treponema sp.]
MLPVEKNLPPDLAGRILHADERCLVVNKGIGESTEPLAGTAGQGAGTAPVDLPALLAEHFGPLQAVHRLDIPVSGCVLFARSLGVRAFLGAAFARPGSVEKTYWAVTALPAGELPETGELVHWIGRGRGNRSLAFDGPGPGRKQAVLRYRIRGRGDRYLFWELVLVTGRHHQIRAQLARIGLPVKGDLKYGAPRSEKGGGIRLHGYSLAFPDPGPGVAGNPPEDGKTIRVTALPPRPDALWEAFIRAGE